MHALGRMQKHTENEANHKLKKNKQIGQLCLKIHVESLVGILYLKAILVQSPTPVDKIVVNGTGTELNFCSHV